MNNNRNQRFKLLSAAADRIVEETRVNPSEVSGYAVSQAAFGKKPNGDFYTLFEEWLKQRRAVPGSPAVDMPADAAAELDEWTDYLKAQIMQRVTGIVRGVAGSFEQTTAMRVIAVERLNADLSRRNSEVIQTLVETEAELDGAQVRIDALTQELRQEHERVQRLLGRMEEREALLQEIRAEAASSSVVPPATADLDTDLVSNDHGGGGLFDEPSGAEAARSDQPVADAERRFSELGMSIGDPAYAQVLKDYYTGPMIETEGFGDAGDEASGSENDGLDDVSDGS